VHVITYEVSDRCAIVTIDDEERHNPLSNEAMAELAEAVQRSAADDEVGVVVITGAGTKAFSAGGDLSGGFVDTPLQDHAARGALAELFRAIRGNPKPVIARVNGTALGGGFGLAVACDITIAVEGARMGTPEIGLGLWPMMISAVLIRAMPRKVLLDMMLTGRIITADEAAVMGLVTRTVPPEDLDRDVRATADALLARSPAALALGKRAFYVVEDMDFDTALDHLHLGLTATALTEDASEGVSAFVEKRSTEWKGR
jgi:enoyl-CoA hydratase/carnithine racemase